MGLTNFPNGITSLGVPLPSGGGLPLGGTTYFVDTVNGNDGYDGKAPSADGSGSGPLSTVERAFELVADNDVVYLKGDIREEVLAPLGVTGVTLIGNVGGQTRHDDGCRWREPASGATTGGALLTLREQGWEVRNILFVPKSDATALRVRRAEDAVYPDGSHAKIVGCKFIGASIATQKGLEDVGGCHHVLVQDCEFITLQRGIINTSTAIANPLRWTIKGNVFRDETTHLDMPLTQSIVRDNVFDEATTNLDTSGGAGVNFVIDNYFANDASDITISDGYTGHASDIWRNFSSATAAMTVGVPA